MLRRVVSRAVFAVLLLAAVILSGCVGTDIVSVTVQIDPELPEVQIRSGSPNGPLMGITNELGMWAEEKIKAGTKLYFLKDEFEFDPEYVTVTKKNTSFTVKAEWIPPDLDSAELYGFSLEKYEAWVTQYGSLKFKLSALNQAGGAYLGLDGKEIYVTFTVGGRQNPKPVLVKLSRGTAIVEAWGRGSHPFMEVVENVIAVAEFTVDGKNYEVTSKPFTIDCAPRDLDVRVDKDLYKSGEEIEVAVELKYPHPDGDKTLWTFNQTVPALVQVYNSDGYNDIQEATFDFKKGAATAKITAGAASDKPVVVRVRLLGALSPTIIPVSNEFKIKHGDPAALVASYMATTDGRPGRDIKLSIVDHLGQTVKDFNQRGVKVKLTHGPLNIADLASAIPSESGEATVDFINGEAVVLFGGSPFFTKVNGWWKQNQGRPSLVVIEAEELGFDNVSLPYPG